jgi:hypothetical protein
MGRPKSTTGQYRRNLITFGGLENIGSGAGTASTIKDIKDERNMNSLKNKKKYSSNKVSIKTSDILKRLNNDSIFNLESESVIQRNRLLLENVIYERKKRKELSQRNRTPMK